jgi:release factor glutamine methyltransferase
LAEHSIRQVLKQAAALLLAAGIDTPRLDAELLLAYVLRRDRAWLPAHDALTLTPDQHTTFERLLNRRLDRVPLAYLTGHKEFYGLDFEVSPVVLIPRPETELLVEKVLAEIGDPLSPISIVEVGTGSGCIAVALALHLPQARIIATELSTEALAVARHNAERHSVTARIAFVQADLLAPLAGPVNLLVCNPPYVSPDELGEAMPEVALHEPRLALAGGGPAGLDVLGRLLAMMARCLGANAAFFIEVGAHQGPAALEMARQPLPQAHLHLEKDLAGRDRLLIGRLFDS